MSSPSGAEHKLREVHDALGDLAEAMGEKIVSNAYDPDEPPDPNYKVLTPTDIEKQREIFDMFDVDGNGQLAALETRRSERPLPLEWSVPDVLWAALTGRWWLPTCLYVRSAERHETDHGTRRTSASYGGYRQQQQRYCRISRIFRVG
jgi:hypothetical protein